MPSTVNNIKIENIAQGAVVQLGDAIQLSPASTSKSFAGSGSSNTGDFIRTFNAISATNTKDPDIKDAAQSEAGNQGVV